MSGIEKAGDGDSMLNVWGLGEWDRERRWRFNVKCLDLWTMWVSWVDGIWGKNKLKCNLYRVHGVHDSAKSHNSQSPICSHVSRGRRIPCLQFIFSYSSRILLSFVLFIILFFCVYTVLSQGLKERVNCMMFTPGLTGNSLYEVYEIYTS